MQAVLMPMSRTTCSSGSSSAIRTLACAVLVIVSILPIPAVLSADGSRVILSQAQLFSLPLPARTRALDVLALEVAQRTSIETELRSRLVSATSAEAYDSPLLFLPANGPLPPLGVEEESGLGTWLRLGGTLVVDWQGGGGQLEPFRASLEPWLAAVLPGASLERIPRSSVVYRSFYRVQYASGRVRAVDDLYGVLLDGRYAVIACFNDLLSAVERGEGGEFRHEVVPGGDEQREEAIRLAVNLVVYALCLDYKDDKVHLDFLKSKRNWRLPGEE